MIKTLGQVAFNVVMKLDNTSDEFLKLTDDEQKRWNDAVVAANRHKADFCLKCGHPWEDHDAGVPAPYCP
jgi:hypothetical protein